MKSHHDAFGSISTIVEYSKSIAHLISLNCRYSLHTCAVTKPLASLLPLRTFPSEAGIHDHHYHTAAFR